MRTNYLQLILTCLLTLFTCQAHALNPTEADKKRCFMDDPENRTITFLYCMDQGYWSGNVTTAFVRGSFNSWKDVEKTQLSYDEASNCWYCTVSYDYVNVPGNSGQPEYKFVINGSYKSAPNWLTDGYKFMTSDQNMIVVFSTDDLDQIKENSARAGYIRPLADFNLDDPVDQAAISNFRLVPGTKALFRSYHPYKSSRGDDKGIDTEYYRLLWVDKLATAAGIQSDICLSDNDENTLTTYTSGGVTYQEAIPEYYQPIIDNHHVLYVNANNKVPSYSYVYTKPTSKYFGDWVKQIVEFIIADDTPAPFQIHCRLGTDRTGVFCAVLAALCGASWDDITADYQATNNMQIQEFRDWHLLAYTFRQLLNVYDVSTVDNLEEALSNYFINGGYLTQRQIDTLKAKLNNEDKLTYHVEVPEGTKVCYISGEMNGWTFDQMTKVDDTHYTLSIYGATTTQKYKYAAGPSWDYGERTADNKSKSSRTYSENDVVAMWKAVYDPEEVVVEPTYISITVKAYSPDGVPTIWWWGGGDKCPDASKTYTWATRPEMPVLGGYPGWYSWTFTDVDETKGINYILTSPGTGTKSEDLHTFTNECRDQYYAITDDPTATIIINRPSAPTQQAEVYTLDGQKVTNSRRLTPGLYIVKTSSVCKKVVFK
ncbi:MAG: tyrosine-protein phosphatase [Prevotella sp.]|nr:tyrosine-protein phosphatase [Prevotella sp.]